MSLQKTNLNVAPFFDDFDESKNFHKVLFRPRPVQARELNQLQTILQEQINRFGKHIFKEGSMVLPGGTRTIVDQDSVSLTLDNTSLANITNHDGQIFIRSSTTNLIAKVLKVMPAEGSDPIVFFLEYQNSGSNNQTKKFTAGESLVVYYAVGNTTTTLGNATSIKPGIGVWVKSLAGVWFARGYFVSTTDQDYVISKMDNDKSIRVGFRVSEDIVDELYDNSLYSNALGYSNFMGPGASRLRLSLTLAGKPVSDTSIDNDFIELLRFEDGAVQSQIQSSEYSEIMKTLAQRTYEESGDYTVTPFDLDIREHLKTGNTGIYTAAQGGSEAKFVAVVKPGIGYVQGYRTENVGNQNVTVSKARNSTVANNAVSAADYGSYLLIRDVFSLPDFDLSKMYVLRDVSNTNIGTFNVRGIQRETDVLWRLFIFNISMANGRSFSETKQVYFADSSNLFTANVPTATINQGQKNDLVFKLPVDSIKSLKPGGVSDTTYSVTRSFNVTTNASGIASVSLGSNEVFDTLSNFDWFIAYTGAGNAGTQIANAASAITLTGTPVGRSISINIGATHANKAIKIIAPVIKTSFIEKTKTITRNTESLVLSGLSTKALAKADVFRIVSIIDTNSGEDLLGYFNLDRGQRPSWYQVASITTLNGAAITRNLTIVYDYFAHSTGDYFSVDSYAGLTRIDIPKFTTYTGQVVSLADCVDFRPLKNVSGAFDGVSLSGEIAKAGGAIRADIEYYLPKMTSVFLDQYGRFGTVDGVSGPNPSIPEVPAGTMRLFNLRVPAYTEDVTKITFQTIDNRRYTMRDIGKMETRLSNLEYYTTLSLLESQTNQEQIIDPATGNNRFKNGFAVDGFTDFSLADTGNLEWMAALDISTKTLKPSFVQNVSDLSFNALSNTQKRTEIFTLSYGEVVSTQQLLATRAVNINPYAVFAWVGAIKLTPSSDYWKDVVYNAPLVINNTVDNTGGATAGTVFNSSWNSWDDSSSSVSASGNRTLISGQTTQTTETTTTATTTTIAESINSSTSDNFVSTSVVPFMRSIDITFNVQKMKPFTRVYPFFDGVPVSSQCRQDGKQYGDAIITDASGSASGVFTVPSNVSFRFRTGTTAFRFSNSPDDARTSDLMDTAAQTLFYSGGTLESRQIEVTNTRTLTASVSVASSVSRSTSTATSVLEQIQSEPQVVVVEVPSAITFPFVSGGGDGADPIAQTFRINESGGAFITRVDIAFATKAEAIPVMLQIRTVTAGFPSVQVLPQAQKILPPSAVNVSANGEALTSFYFDDPVYLRENNEYAIVLLADTQEYTVYVAQMGEGTLVGQQAVSKQPHVGTFFQSANGSTWSANQDIDMKFVLYRAKFNAGSVGQIVLQGSEPVALPIKFNAIRTVVAGGGSTYCLIEMANHGLKVGDTFTISGAGAGNGLSAANINRTHTVTTISNDFIGANIPGTMITAGYIGGNNIMVKANNAFSLFYSNFASMVLPNTAIVWEHSYRQQSNRAFTPWVKFQPNTNVPVISEGVVKTGSDFLIRATLSSSVENLSPIIDTSGMQTILVDPRLNADNTEPQCRYVSKDIKFNTPSTSAKFFVAAKLPNTSSMKVFWKPITNNDVDTNNIAWVPVEPTTSLKNDSNIYFDYQYNIALTGGGSFLGYKLKIHLLGSDKTDLPSLKSIRTIALA